MASGKSCSVMNPDGIRRVVNGMKLAKRSKRKNERVVSTEKRWLKSGDKFTLSDVIIERFVSKVFE